MKRYANKMTSKGKAKLIYHLNYHNYVGAVFVTEAYSNPTYNVWIL